MPRPPIERSVGGVPRVTLYPPAGVPTRALERLQLTVDELEAIRLVDLEGLSHEQAAAAMGISRQTVGRVLERGRALVADALVSGKALLIGGGQYRIEPPQWRCFSCGARWFGQEDPAAASRCPECESVDVGVCWGAGQPCQRSRRGRLGCNGPQGRGGSDCATSQTHKPRRHWSSNA
jgi:uncharacterized protein